MSSWYIVSSLRDFFWQMLPSASRGAQPSQSIVFRSLNPTPLPDEGSSLEGKVNIFAQNIGQKVSIVDPKIALGVEQVLQGYEIGDSLGGGAYGRVYAADHAEFGPVAIKLMNYEHVKEEASLQMTPDRMSGEALALSNNHPNLVPTLALIAVDSQGNVGIYYGEEVKALKEHVIVGVISRLIPQGENLERLIFKNPEAFSQMDRAAKKQILREIGGAVLSIHDQNMLYRDLKPGNIILDQEGKAYLLDFGFQKLLDEKGVMTRSFCGSPYHAAPEVVTTGVTTTLSDSFSYGILLYEVVFGRNPFDAKGLKGEGLKGAIKNFNPSDYIPQNYNPKNPDHVAAWELFQGLTNPSMMERTSIRDALEKSRFFNEGKGKEAEVREDEAPPLFVGNPAFKKFALSKVSSDPLVRCSLEGALEDLQVGDCVGKGAYGRVFKAYHPHYGTLALKFIPYEIAQEKRFLQISQERVGGEALAVLMQTHPHVVKNVAVVAIDREGKAALYGIEELSSLDGLVIVGVFSRFVEDSEELGHALPRMDMPSKKRVLKQVGSALASLHAEKLVHRDIKPDNILLSNGNAYLIDFGFLKRVEEAGSPRTRTQCGAYYYVAPEVAEGSEDTNPKSDSFSFGIVLYEAVFGRNPFEGMREDEALKAIVQMQSIEDYCPKNFNPSNPDHIAAWDLIIQLTCRNSAERISIDEALKHPFF